VTQCSQADAHQAFEVPDLVQPRRYTSGVSPKRQPTEGFDLNVSIEANTPDGQGPFAVFCLYNARAAYPDQPTSRSGGIRADQGTFSRRAWETITSTLEDSVRLSELLESLLLLARADTPGIQLKREEIDVSVEVAPYASTTKPPLRKRN